MNPVPAISNQDNLNQTEETREGIVFDVEALNLDLEDDEINRIIGTRIEDSESWWNKELNLKQVRERAEKYYNNMSYDERDLYEHQIPYKNNRILLDIEVLVPLSVSQPAQPVVTEAQDTDTSRQLAKDLGDTLLSIYEDEYIKSKLTMAVSDLYKGKRIGILKYRFDASKGKLNPDGTRRGKITVDHVRPERVVIAQGTTRGQNPAFIAEYCTATIEKLCSLYPKKKDEIFKDQGIVRGVKTQMQREVGYWEIWFSYFDADGAEQEGTCWKLNKVILDKMQNPHWNYDDYEVDQATGKAVRLNFLDFPEKPYKFFNHINSGKYVYDDTSLIDQVIPLQDVLNKRGRQIAENADQASSGMVLNSNMISEEDAKKLIGDPSEKIMVDGDVRAAAARLPYNPLPQYVVQDKLDARAEIDNIFGANAPIKGESSGLDTLGQEVLSQRANMGRLQTIADVIEDGMDGLYKGLVQMMKVFWDEPEIVTLEQADGRNEFLSMSQDKIEDGVKVRVKSGSVLPKDKATIKNETIQTQASLDPLSLAEGLDKPNPKEWAKRIVYYRFFMDKYLTETLGEGGDGMDSQALADIQALMSGQTPPVPNDISKEYLAVFDQFLKSQGFQQIQDPNIKKNIVEFVKQINEKAKSGLGEGSTDTASQEQAGANADVNAQTAVAPAAGNEPPATGGSIQPTGQGGNILSRGVQALMSRFKK